VRDPCTSAPSHWLTCERPPHAAPRRGRHGHALRGPRRTHLWSHLRCCSRLGRRHPRRHPLRRRGLRPRQRAPGRPGAAAGRQRHVLVPRGPVPTAPTLAQCAWFAVRGAASGWLNVTQVTILNATAARLSAALPAAAAAARLRGLRGAAGGGTSQWPRLGRRGAPTPSPRSTANGLPATPWNATL